MDNIHTCHWSDVQDSCRCDLLVSGSEAVSFFSDVFEDYMECTGRKGEASLLEQWDAALKESGEVVTSNEQDLLTVIERRLRRCVESQLVLEMYVESFDSFEPVSYGWTAEVGPDSVNVIGGKKRKGKGKSNKQEETR